MTRSVTFRNVCSVLSLLAPLLATQAAFGQQACGDRTCPKGFTCEMQPTACPLVDCVGESCEPCEPSTVAVCRPGPCSADGDCADGMICAELQQTDCPTTSAPGKAPDCAGGDCAETPADSSCTTTTVKQCLPRWLVACSADTDCGAGFTCKEQQECSCSGSGGSGTGSSPPSSGEGSSGSADPAQPAPTPSSSSTPPDREPPDCSCMPTGKKACEATRTACAADSDCPSGWSCRDNPEGSCWVDSNGNMGCTPTDPPKLCFPPFSDVLDAGGGRGIATDAAGLPENPKGDTAGSAPTSGSESGGCSLNTRRPASGFELLSLGTALAAAFGLSRRRARRGRG